MSIAQSYILIFSAHFNRDSGLDQGRLVLENLITGHQAIWIASSSHTKGQEKEGFHYKGGMIPPAYRCPKLAQWMVETQPLDLSHVRGVAGNFYRLLPFEVTTDKNGVRGDFGIHLDANVPGSLGCPVMTAERFNDFENTMTRLRKEGVEKLPFVPIYS